ncbi:DUF397 domain-containing protein [Streptomyces sp. NPDC021356]|uniref:DUF397 domain-containing protein n=1 Tax=Streptomyces sp. NPDC021356 TaxID=3154900 RepID=UPI0033F20E4B
MTALHWFKSSYSGNDGPDCVEVALDWFKSSYSSNEGPDCVEVAIAAAPAAVHVRDSKARDGDQLAFAGSAWAEFLGFAARR